MRQVTPLKHSRRPYFVGIDVGGTNTKIGIVDDLGQTLSFASIATNEEEGPGDLFRRTAAAVDQMNGALGISAGDLKAAGLGTPGPMDIAQGMILDPTNMPHWRFFPVRDELSKILGLPVAFNNDANAAAYGEFWVGSGQKYDGLILLTLGTGVGGGIIVNDRVIEGVNSFGAECGHIIVDSRPDARLCVWGGGRGELEAYASASALADRAEKLLAQGRSSSLTRRVTAGETMSTLLLAEEAEAGDDLSREVILEAATYLGIGVVTLVHTIDPGAVILGGAMNFGGHNTHVGRAFIERVREEFCSRAFEVVVKGTLIDYASLGGDAGFIGAAGIARTKIA
ncbi:MAG: ROK family protein [Pirellulaceae bacterium]